MPELSIRKCLLLNFMDENSHGKPVRFARFAVL
jgi:hypothetical protein